MEYFDICSEEGDPTGEIVEREDAHRRGIRHRTAHVWVVRREHGRIQVLLQQRSFQKDSFPGQWDTSSAGHIPAGCEPLDSALRELREELGIEAAAEDLKYIGHFDIRYEKMFHGQMFRDNEFSHVFSYCRPVDILALTLQKEEVEKVDWFDLEELLKALQNRPDWLCVPTESISLLRDAEPDLNI